MQNFLDLDAFVPRAFITIKWKGKTYQVFDLLDLPYEHYLELIAIDERIKGKSDEEALEMLATQVNRLAPAFERDQLRKMSIREIGALIVFLKNAISANHKSGEGGEGKATESASQPS